MQIRQSLCAAIAISLLAVASVRAQVPPDPYTWKSVKITAGGFITGIVFSPKEAGLAYCRTDIGGAYRFDAKFKQWIPLTDWVGPRNSNLGGCESVAADPTDPDKVYLALGTYNRGIAAIARSTDRGKSFALTQLPISMGANENGRGMGERLAVDPSDPRVLYFGSRRDGLWRSADGAETWAKVASFPVAAAAQTVGAPGIPWVIFDPRKEDKAGEPTRILLAGVASGADSSLFRSLDAGKTWQAVPNAPALMPHRAALDSTSHTLFISFGNGPGPNDVTAGAVWKFEIDASKWTNITPNNPGNGGYGGIALDPQKPGALMVSTIDHWGPADAIFRSTDGGTTWKAINATADRQPAGTPYMANLLRGHQFDWWLAALAIDPFDSNHVLYGTGAGIWGTHNMTEMDAGRRTQWNIEADGIEETAVLALASPPWGDAHLISGVGDIGGFTHGDLTVSPAAAHVNPMFSNTNSIEYAEFKPVVVRTGTANRNGGGQTAALSEDGGITWKPLQLPGNAPAGGRGGGGQGAYLTVSSDGETLLTANAAGGAISKDKGATWTDSTGLFAGARPIADRGAPHVFYAFDSVNARLYTSYDAGATFTASSVKGVASNAAGGVRGAGPAPVVLKSSYAGKGDLWISSGGALFHSTDAGATFERVARGNFRQFSFGKPAPNHSDLTIFVAGTIAGLQSIFRSDDGGKTWLRINDDQHQFGGTPTVIAADPRVFGRLYIGMNGRGILYGDANR